MTAHNLHLSTALLNFILRAEGETLSAVRLESRSHVWIESGRGNVPLSGLFTVYADGQRLDATTLRLINAGPQIPPPEAQGALYAVLHFQADQPALRVTHHLLVYPNTALIESWQIVQNIGNTPCQITRLDSVALSLPPDQYTLQHFTSDWGQEFEPDSTTLTESTILETRFGRSSKGMHPWFALTRSDGAMLSGSVAWSGNWVFRFDRTDQGGVTLSGGLHDWGFSSALQPGESIESPRVILSLGDSMNQIAQQYASVGRTYWYPRNTLTESLPVEWNHWWSYEDRDINEDLFRRNVDAAARLGVEICTLDAGWFGASDSGTEWYDQRGDWDQVNTERFPSGIRTLSDYTHAHGMKFGLWCEIEGLGKKAQLARSHPDFPATRGSEWLGYVCFGNPAAQEWAFQTLSRLITEYDCDWLKLDFNLEPYAGCDRTDHGHGVGDGLYAHYRGYYALLDRVRKAFPDVVLENCSSGGLRIDLGMQRHTHLTFLSDPDWPAHHLQVFWGVSAMLAPNAGLHWSYSEWRGANPHQRFNPRDPNLTPRQFDYYTRMAMLSAFGISQKLPDLPAWVATRLTEHIHTYRNQVRRFIRDGILYRLTDQPRRSGNGDGWCAFQYSLSDGAEHALFMFRLPGADSTRVIRLQGLEPDRIYHLTWSGEERNQEISGLRLMEEGITFDSLLEEDSALIYLR